MNSAPKCLSTESHKLDLNPLLLLENPRLSKKSQEALAFQIVTPLEDSFLAFLDPLINHNNSSKTPFQNSHVVVNRGKAVVHLHAKQPEHAGASALILLEPSVQNVLDLPQALQFPVGWRPRAPRPTCAWQAGMMGAAAWSWAQSGCGHGWRTLEAWDTSQQARCCVALPCASFPLIYSFLGSLLSWIITT